MTKNPKLLESHTQISELFQIYGDFLAERQYQFIYHYINDNMPIVQIAKKYGIMGHCVHDRIQNGFKNLLFLESKMHLLEKKKQAQKEQDQINEAKSILDEMSSCLDKSDINGIKDNIFLLRQLLKED